MKPKIKALTWAFLFVMGVIPLSASAQTLQCITAEQKVVCQAELAKAEAEAKAAQSQLTAAQAQSASITRDISVLDAKIKVAEANIRAKNLLIQTLGNDIQTKVNHIEALDKRIEKSKETLAQFLRKTNEIDDASLPEVLLSQRTVSGFFNDVDTFQSVQEGLRQLFEQLRSDQAETTTEKEALDKRRNTEIDARYDIQQEEKNIQSDKAQRKELLAVSKGSEKAYSNLVSEKSSRAAQIRAALFPLAGGGQAIKFEQALEYATLASQKTGVRPAFLLAVLQNESALGANVGQCYLANTSTGDGVYVKTGKFSSHVMAPGRPASSRNDVEKFMEITKSLGLDPFKTVVSCQQVSVGGWGGAMGPAQFIPSTWALFVSRIKTGLNLSETPNPWNPAHAFMASALYLSDLGAGAGGYTAERNAACRYYSGRPCSTSNAIASYGNQAVAEATRQQAKINQL